MPTSNELPSDHHSYSEARSSMVSTFRPARVASIDIFRGLTMLVMIFVNQLGEMKGLPWWTLHMPPNINGMTYVDMVFPFFLFIVGMSLPLAVQHRLSKGDSECGLWVHVASRSVGLMVLGLILANRDKVDPQWTHIGANAWKFLALLGAILFWISYPNSLRYMNLFKVLKIAGLVVLLAMLVVFRRLTPEGHVAWIDTSYWEILGIIGWAYLSVCILYIPTRRWRWMQVAWFIALSVMNIFSSAHWLTFTYKLPNYIWPFKTGAGQSIVMAGILTSLLFLTDAFAVNRRQKTILALGFAAALFVAGWLLSPLGISKVRATPTWCFVCSGAAICAFLVLYWICDVQKRVRWALPAKPAGSNTLLTYLLSPLCAAVCGREVLLARWNYGWPGAVQAVAFTAGIITISAILTRLKVRMQL
jgi:heparan-alpha-glucosaminide N-acetyltransferase